ncbi:MAG: ribosome assembly RNA-binding protein YhbY [bacterium]|jgi:RNA-binding protein
MTGKHKRFLRSLSHSLKPLMHVGKSGLTESFLKELEANLDHHELLKIKVLDESPDDRKACASRLDGLREITLVQQVGKTLTLYRPRPEDPVIQLP